MNRIIDTALSAISAAGNLRRIPRHEELSQGIDFSSNDYLGLAARSDIRDAFLENITVDNFEMSSSASRLLSRRQNDFDSLEDTLSDAYGRQALVFNSGYHANTGLIGAFASTKAFVIADKLVHASIIDGIKLSGLPFARFRHNDLFHLDRLAGKAYGEGYSLIIIAESVYSMDGDKADIDGLAEIKRRYPGTLLYIDEAHAVGVEGPAGLGLCKASGSFGDVDIIVGTLGKALASTGAYAILSRQLRKFMVNKSRSLIFSTAIPPLCARWSEYVFRLSLEMDTERKHLHKLGHILAQTLSKYGGAGADGHIQPLLTGSPQRAVELSMALTEKGLTVLPIRTPTVPPGTDRLRFSLSAALSLDDMACLDNALCEIFTKTKS